MSTSYTPGKGSGDPDDQNRNSSVGHHSDAVDRTPITDDQTSDADRPAGDDTRTKTFDRRDVSPDNGNADRIQGERDVDRSHRLDPDTDGRNRAMAGGAGAGVAGAGVINRESNAAREKEAYGGIKFGSAFFGWLAATGMTVLLTALVAAIAAAVGAATGTGTSQVVQDPQAAGIWGIVVLLVILFIAYYCGGYVAGRMARFDGVKQGLAVWLWAIIVAIIATIIGAIVGSQLGALSNFNGMPQIQLDQGMMTTAGIVTLVGLVLVTLGGALLGGMAGMRFHRKVDRAGFDLDNDRHFDRR